MCKPPFAYRAERLHLYAMSETLRLTYDAGSVGIAILTFNRPSMHNALDLVTMRRFADTIGRLGKTTDLRAVILTGAGSAAFCSGADLREMNTLTTEAQAHGMIALMGDALLALERLPVPVIAAINGYALGGGSEIALACDLRIVDEQVRLGFVQVKRGLIPGWGGGQRLLRLVGYAQALDLFLSGRLLHHDDLLALGLATRVVPTGQALEYAISYARQIVELDREAVRSLKVALQAGVSQPYEAALQTERALFPSLWVGEAHRQSTDEFLKKSR